MPAAHMCPFLSFTDSAAEAMALYHSVFGGSVTSTTFAEGGMSDDPAEAGLVMHSQLDADGFTLMCADTPMSLRDGEPKQHHPVCLWGDDESTLRGWWDGLADGGTVHMPLEKAPWGDYFGQLADRYGVTWMVNISAG